MSIELNSTNRGFAIAEFRDRCGVACSLQKSSAGSEDAIWLGVDDTNPQVLRPGIGWIPYPMPSEVSLYTRMHLTQTQVRDLLPLLQKFAETGELS